MKCYGVMTVYPRVGRDKLDPRDVYVAGIYAFEMDDEEERMSAEAIVERIGKTFRKAVRIVVPEHFSMQPRIADTCPGNCRLILVAGEPPGAGTDTGTA